MNGLVVFLAAVNAGLLLSVVVNAVRERRLRLALLRGVSHEVVWFVPLPVSGWAVAPEWGGSVGPIKGHR